MLNFIYDAYLYQKFYSRNNLQRNRASFLKLTHILKNENFIDYYELLNLHLLRSLDSKEYQHNTLVTHNRKMESNRLRLFTILKSLIDRHESDYTLNLADVKFIKASRDAVFYSLFDNVYDWWEYTLTKGNRYLSPEEVKEILDFKIEKIDKIIQSDDFKSNHCNFTKFSWHKGIAAENAGGSHRLAYVIKLCQFFNISAPYKTNLITYSLNKGILENLLSEFSVYICFDFLVDSFHTLLRKENNDDIEYYSFTYSPSFKNNGKPDIVFFIIKNNYQSKVFRYFLNKHLNSQDELKGVLHDLIL
ncbi:DUF6685 family protein [Acinetobacter baumannii]|uniref:DUF6685 family protein n=1 Tax=Acinetobacter baumannii TaxID=470 RepID=UPI0033902668